MNPMPINTARTALGLFLAVALLAAPSAAAETFKMSAKAAGLNRVTFDNDAPFETISGVANGVTGEFTLDLAKPNSATGRLVIPVAAIKTGIDMRDEHLRAPDWLDAAKHPNITFEITKVDLKGDLATDGGTAKGRVTGRITIKGKTRNVTAVAKVSYHKSSEILRKAWIQGDALRVRAGFKINIRDFGINPPDNIAGVKVADEVEIKVNLTPTNG